MKQKFTLLFVSFCLLTAFSGKTFGQILLIEGFEENTFPPNNPTYGQWTQNGSGSSFSTCSTVWQQVQSNVATCPFSIPVVQSHGGSYDAGYNSYNIYAGISDLVSPNMAFPSAASATTQYVLSFWVYEYNYVFGSTTLKVMLVQGANPPYTALNLPTPVYNVVSSTATNGWQHITYTFPAGSITGPGNYNVVFEASGAGDDDFYIDDINITRFVPCTGIPASHITGPNHVCPNIPYTLIDSATAGLSGMLYQWQSRPAGTSNLFANITGATSSVFSATFGSSSALDYRVIAKCTNSSLSDTSTTFTLNINNIYTCYCGPSLGNSLGGNAFPELDSVGIAATTLHHASYGPLPNYYASYPPVGNTTANLAQGGTYRIASLTSDVGQKGAAWIDYGHFGNFSATADYIAMSGPLSSNVLTGTINVPLNATLGLTGLRVRVSGQTLGAGSPCTVAQSGETEDYIVNIVPPLNNDVGATAIIAPVNGDLSCTNTNITVRVALSNFGSSTQHNFMVYAFYHDPNNVNGPVINTQYTGYLAGFGKDTITIGTMTMPIAGTYYVTAYTYLANDQNFLNDTTYGSAFTVTETPLNPVVTSDTVCLGNPATISVQNVGSTIFNWYNAPSAGNIVYPNTLTKYFPSLQNTTTYFVAATSPGSTGRLPTSSTPIDTAGLQASPGGIFFDIVPAEDLVIDSFSLRFADTGLHLVKIYYRLTQPSATPGPYPTGNTQNLLSSQAQWVQFCYYLVHVTDISNHPSSLYHIPLNSSLPLTFGSGIDYTIYLDYDAEVGTNAMPNLGQNLTYGTQTFGANDAFYYGKALASDFGNVSSNFFKFNGAAYYHTGGSGCQSPRIPITAAVRPGPQVYLSPEGNVCWTPDLHLDAGNPGAVYTWKENTPPATTWTTSTNTSQVLPIPLSDTGTHSYAVLVDRYCNAYDTVTMTIQPPPYATGINYTSQGNTYFFSVSGARDVWDYYWEFGDGGTSVQLAPVHTYADASPRLIRLIVYNNCGSDTLLWTVPTLKVPGVASSSDAIQLYPNPANTSITISGADNMEIKDIMIVNSVGAVVYRSVSDKIKKDNIDVSGLPQGNYILRANTSDGYYNKLFTIVH